MPIQPSIVFFGSFLQYSAEILSALIEADHQGKLKLLGVVTTPPQPAGRKKELKKTEVHELAENQNVLVATPEILDEDQLNQVEHLFGSTPDLIITAGYGKLLPASWLAWPQHASLNLHFSLLPKYRGANPAEWAILMGETQTGITLIEMSPEFDTGAVVSQIALPLTPTDTRETTYGKLYRLGAETLPSLIQAYAMYRMTKVSSSQVTGQVQESLVINEKVYQVSFFYPPQVQAESPTPYAKRFQKDDGYIEWAAIQQTMAGQTAETTLASPLLQTILIASHQLLDATFVERATRALAGFPGVWTRVKTSKGEKRMKILQTSVRNDAASATLVLDQVQIEGQSPAAWNQVKNSVV